MRGWVVTARRTLLTASLGTLTVLVAFTAPLAGFTQTVAGLGSGPAGATWVLSSMSIGLGGFLLTAGRLADDYGRRRWFAFGALVLGLSSLVAALSQDVVTFVVARIVSGAGGAAVIAAGLGMIAAAHPVPADRARATGVWGASVGGGIAIGPLLGNYLGLVHSWRDVYVVLLVAGLALTVAARGCPESRSGEPAAPGGGWGGTGRSRSRCSWWAWRCCWHSSPWNAAPTTRCSTSGCSGDRTSPRSTWPVWRPGPGSSR
jgi:MFS family permease